MNSSCPKRIVGVIPSQFFPEVLNVCPVIDGEKFNSRNVSKVSQMIARQCLANASVVRAACINPCTVTHVLGEHVTYPAEARLRGTQPLREDCEARVTVNI